MKELIKRLESHKGEVKQDWKSDNKVVVKFVPKKLIGVSIDNNEQWEFMRIKTGLYTKFRKDSFIIPSTCQFGGTNTSEYNVIPFTKYISDNDLKDEYQDYLFTTTVLKYPIGIVFIDLVAGNERVIDDYDLDGRHFEIGLDGKCILNLGKASLYNTHTGEWATIIEPKLELVKGEIYYHNNNDLVPSIFRCKKTMFSSNLLISERL